MHLIECAVRQNYHECIPALAQCWGSQQSDSNEDAAVLGRSKGGAWHAKMRVSTEQHDTVCASHVIATVTDVAIRSPRCACLPLCLCPGC